MSIFMSFTVFATLFITLSGLIAYECVALNLVV